VPDSAMPTILVVDDSPSLVSYLRDALSAAKYAVLTAGNGREAVSVIKSGKVDIILCDLQMPEMDGKKLRKKLLANSRFCKIPFVAMSTHDTVENYNAMRELKAAAFLTKPFNPEQLFILLNRLHDEARIQELNERKLVKLEKNMLIRSIMSLAEALDARDNHTRTHSDSVSKVAMKIAVRMDIDRHSIKQLYVAGKLHDIGKIGIADAILQKPGRLTEEEYTIIKTHPEVGARILTPIPSLRDIAEIIHCHHERPDGTGYPRGLRGGEIHFLANILSVADVFDALTSDRPYRPGMSPEDSLAIMAQGRATQFHPECLDALVELARTGVLDGIGRRRRARDRRPGGEAQAGPEASSPWPAGR